MHVTLLLRKSLLVYCSGVGLNWRGTSLAAEARLQRSGEAKTGGGMGRGLGSLEYLMKSAGKGTNRPRSRGAGHFCGQGGLISYQPRPCATFPKEP